MSDRDENHAPCPLPRCLCAHVAHASVRSSVCPNCGHDLMVQSREARAWLAGWQVGHDDYDQGTDTPNPFHPIAPVVVSEVIHEERHGVCIGCEQFGEPVEWLLAEARGHSRADA